MRRTDPTQAPKRDCAYVQCTINLNIAAICFNGQYKALFFLNLKISPGLTSLDLRRVPGCTSSQPRNEFQKWFAKHKPNHLFSCKRMFGRKSEITRLAVLLDLPNHTLLQHWDVLRRDNAITDAAPARCGQEFTSMEDIAVHEQRCKRCLWMAQSKKRPRRSDPPGAVKKRHTLHSSPPQPAPPLPPPCTQSTIEPDQDRTQTPFSFRICTHSFVYNRSRFKFFVDPKN